MRDDGGRFLAGPHAARHTFTRAERRRGYRHAVRSPRRGTPCGDGAAVLAWVCRRVRGYYRAWERDRAAAG
jgi:hypothetical protein